MGPRLSRFRRIVREALDVAAVEAPNTLANSAADSAGNLASAAAAGVAGATGEPCDLCGTPIPAEHRHLYEAVRDRLLCVCQACTLLFDRGGAGGDSYRLVPTRVVELTGFDLDDALWERFGIPVDLAFCRRMGAGERVVIHYPGALGAVEARVEAGAWTELEERNPVLRELQPGVEALLINRIGDVREYWIAPLDLCYELTGLIRKNWSGIGGGDQVRAEVSRFFARLRRQPR